MHRDATRCEPTATSGADTDTPDRPLALVIGAGITGLVAARALAAGGARVRVLEAADTIGGQLTDVEVAGYRVDAGAESVFTAAPGPLELIDELGLSDEVVPANRATTWIQTPQGLRPLPEGFTPAGPSRLGPVLRARILSVRGMLRAGLEPLIGTQPVTDELSVGDYLARRFGNEVTDRLVDPLLGGLHAGDVRRLGLRAATPQLAGLAAKHRSLLLRRRPAPRSGPAFVTLREGMGALPRALAAALPEVVIEHSTPVAHIEAVGPDQADAPDQADTPNQPDAPNQADASGTRVRVTTTDGRQYRASAVVVATPAAVASRLLATASPDAAAALAQLRAASVAIAALAYPPAASAVPAIRDGTGMLVPSTGSGLLKAATFLSTKWPHHRHDDVVLIRMSAGRAGDDRAINLDDDVLVTQLHAELAAATGLDLAPLAASVRRWPETMPQLEVGHAGRMATITQALRRDLPGVAVAGAPYHGPGLSSCLRSATLACAQVLEHKDA